MIYLERNRKFTKIIAPLKNQMPENTTKRKMEKHLYKPPSLWFENVSFRECQKSVDPRITGSSC